MNLKMSVVVLAVAAGSVLVATPAAAAGSASADPAAAAATASFAPGSIQEVWAQTLTSASSRGIARATCPAGTTVISSGGGGDIGYLDNITPVPNGGDTFVTARATALSWVYAQALCAPTAQFAGTTIATVEEPRHVEPNVFSRTVLCPAGMVAFGGGGLFRSSNDSASDSGYLMTANTRTRNGIRLVVHGDEQRRHRSTGGHHPMRAERESPDRGRELPDRREPGHDVRGGAGIRALPGRFRADLRRRGHQHAR